MTVVEDVAARLRAQVPSRTVYEWAVPDGTLPAAYLLVRASIADETSERMVDTTHVAYETVRVLSAARNDNPHSAARTADAGLRFARAALRDYRPSSGQWRLRFETGSDPYRDESVTETTFVAAAQYRLRSSL